MTQSDYFTSPSGYGVPTVPVPTATATAPRRSVAAVIGTVVFTALSIPAALVAAFAAAVTWSGCFISCTGPDHVAGALLWLLVVAILSAGPALAAGVLRTRKAVIVTAILPGLVATALLVSALLAALSE